jgi:hypothetical protein
MRHGTHFSLPKEQKQSVLLTIWRQYMLIRMQSHSNYIHGASILSCLIPFGRLL